MLFQGFVVRVVLEELDLTIYARASKTEHGKQLSSNARIMELFEMLKTAGRTVVIPKVTWEAERPLTVGRLSGVITQDTIQREIEMAISR